MTPKQPDSAPETPKQGTLEKAPQTLLGKQEKRPLEGAEAIPAPQTTHSDSRPSDAQRAPPTAAPTADPDAVPPSFAQMWDTAYGVKEHSTWPIKVAAICFLVIMVGVFVRQMQMPWTQASLVGALSMVDASKSLHSLSAQNAWIQKMQSEKPVSILQDAEHTAVALPPGTSRAHQLPKNGSATARNGANQVAGQGSHVPDIDPFYKEIFGSGKRLGGNQPLSRRDAGGKAGDSKKSVAGLVLHARLKDRVASTPTNAPVIAHLVQDMQLGPHCLKAGTQLNGRTAGHDAIRVFIVFDSLRLADGAVIAFLGTTRDAEGQVGLPGIKQITHHTTNSIALQGAV
ncbi:MAG: hypothetical protein EOO40_02010, partial [Deltaproteobacteria bacterium]